MEERQRLYDLLDRLGVRDKLGYHLRETYWDGNAYQEIGEWIAYEGSCG